MILQLSSEETTANSYLIVEDSDVLLIDAVDGKKIQSLLCARSWNLHIILLTHEHVDHICGLNALRSITQAPAAASAACSRRLQNPRENLSSVYDLLIYASTGVISPERHDPFSCLPCELTFRNHLTFHWKTHRFFMQCCPGHSPGSSVICMDDSFLFSGDYLLPDMPVNLTLSGGNEADYRAITVPWLKKQLRTGMTIFPGHGTPYVYSTRMLSEE